METAAIPTTVLRMPLAGRQLPAATLEYISQEPTLLVFLRHFG